MRHRVDVGIILLMAIAIEDSPWLHNYMLKGLKYVANT